MYPPFLETFKTHLGQDPEQQLALSFAQVMDKIFMSLLQTKFHYDSGNSSVLEGLVGTTLLMDHAVKEPSFMLGHFLRDLQHQPKIEDDQKQDQCGFTVINKSDYLNGTYTDMKF